MPRLKDYEQTVLCKDCFFLDLCKDVNLPNCDGDDYVKQRKS